MIIKNFSIICFIAFILEKYPSVPPFSSTPLTEEIQTAYEKFNKETPHLETPSEYIKKSKTIQASRRAIRDKALANKHAVYRAKRKVKTAVDDEVTVEYSSDSFDSTESYEPSTSTQQNKSASKGKTLMKKNIGSRVSKNKKTHVESSNSSEDSAD